MEVNNKETTDSYPSTNTRSVFFCPTLPRALYLGLKKYNHSLDPRGHHTYCLRRYHSLEYIGNHCYQAEERTAKTCKNLLGMRKPHASQPEAVALRFVKTNESYGSVGQTKKSLAYKSSTELVAGPSSYRQPRMTRSTSCDAAIFVDFVHSLAKPHKIVLRRKLSASI